jgi:hypothetical protein
MADAHPWPAWFHDTVKEAQLLTNRTLRNFLLAHSAERWPELVKAACLYGVLCLQVGAASLLLCVVAPNPAGSRGGGAVM